MLQYLQALVWQTCHQKRYFRYMKNMVRFLIFKKNYKKNKDNFISFSFFTNKANHDMGLYARKPVLVNLRTIKGQSDQHIFYSLIEDRFSRDEAHILLVIWDPVEQKIPT